MTTLESLPFSFVESLGFGPLLQNIIIHKDASFSSKNIANFLHVWTPALKLQLNDHFITTIWSNPRANISLINLKSHGITEEERLKIIL